MVLRIQNPNSPQVKFTDNTEQNLLDFRDYVSKLNNKTLTYKEFQDEVDILKFNTSTYVRVEFPFFKNAGLINDYKVIDSNLLTKLGNAYCYVIENIRILRNSFLTEENQKLLDEFLVTRQNIIKITIKSLTNINSCEYGQVLKKMILFLINFSSIDETEFALILDQMKLLPTVPISQTERIVEDYRNNSDSLHFQVETKKKSTGIIELENNTNCYSYFIGILQDAGIGTIDKGRLYLNKKIKDQLIENYGGKYE